MSGSSVFDRALRRQLPALARAGPGARDHAQRRRSIDQLRQAHREPFAREHGADGFGLQRDAAQGEDSNAEQLRGNDAGHPPSLRFGAASLGSRDSHISYIKIYWDSNTTPTRLQAWHYDPPAGYDYQWSGD